MSYNDRRILRRRIDDTVEALDRARRPDGNPGAPTIFGPVVNGGSMPTTVPGTFLITPSVLTSPLQEGAASTVAPVSGNTELVTVLGPGVPGVGDYLIARLAPGSRWVADYGTTNKKGQCCDCIPATLILDSDLTAVESNTIGLFGYFASDVSPIEFTWQASPIQTIGLDYGLNLPYLGYQSSSLEYLNLPPFGWFSKVIPGHSNPFYGLATYDCIYWLKVVGCGITISVIVLYPFTATGSIIVNDPIGHWERKTISAQGWLANTASINIEDYGALLGWGVQVTGVLTGCDVDIGSWLIQTVEAVAGAGDIAFSIQSNPIITDAIDLFGSGNSSYGYGYYGKCISRDELNANGNGETAGLTGMFTVNPITFPLQPGLGPLCIDPFFETSLPGCS